MYKCNLDTNLLKTTHIIILNITLLNIYVNLSAVFRIFLLVCICSVFLLMTSYEHILNLVMFNTMHSPIVGQ